MARTSVKKNIIKPVNYLNKDFNDFRDNLIEFAKVYFPKTHNDFNESSPGMMFIEMAAYVGDVLSYYVDSQFRESLLAYAEEKRNVYNIAQSFGYKPKVTTPANAVCDVFQTVPALNNEPDYRYALNVKAGARIKSTSTGTTFRTLEDVNFQLNSNSSPRVVSVFESNSGSPTKFLLKKQVKVESGEITSETFTFGTAEKYSQIKLAKSDVIEIISCTDSDNNTWNEVDSLARDTVFDEVENNSVNDPTSVINRETSPYILKLKKTARRFTTYINESDETILNFGAGVSDNPDEEIIPNPDSVGSNLPGSPTFLTRAFDPSNFLRTQAFGTAPSNTTLTIEYSYGGGISDNVSSNDITELSAVTFEIQDALLSTSLVQQSKDSVAFTNTKPATGGSSGETVRETRENALAYFQSQQRAVTREDYMNLAYRMPAKFGKIKRANIVNDPSSSNRKITLYVVSENDAGNLGHTSQVTKNNIKNWLNHYIPINDSVEIKDAIIVNFTIDFTVMYDRNYDPDSVIFACMEKLKTYFNETLYIGEPLYLTKIYNTLNRVTGVADVKSVIVENKTDSGYSPTVLEMEDAMSKDGTYIKVPKNVILELKYPSLDIKGTVR